MQSYKQQFTLRNQREDVITKEEDKLNQIMSSFEKAGFLGVTAPSELDNGLALDNKMDVLNHFAEKMMSDTNRFDISDKTGLLVNGKLSLEDLVQGARFYFSGPDGKTKYQAFLKDRFGINPFPKLSDIQGAWDNGSMTITDVILSDELKKEIADGKPPKDDGCDFTMDFSALKGKTVPFTFTITSTSDTAGNMEFTSQGQSPQTMPFTYTDGVIAATMSQKGAVGTITMTISEDANAYAATGTMKVDYKSGMVVILASVTASKGKSK
jgi:hypothetical protein